jgi:UDP-N-acetylmuramate--alanine ligase
VLAHLREVVQPGDMVITLGAGNVWQVGEELLASLLREQGAGGPGAA